MILTERQKTLFEFVKLKHGDQKRKYTGEAYFHHLLSVAAMAARYEPAPGVIEIALCHDILEDTDCIEDELQYALRNADYRVAEYKFILQGVRALTDLYTKENYSGFNRKQRKEKEAIRLGSIKPIFQSIKYADLIDNTISIVEHDKKFAEVYLKEKIAILDKMREGNIYLFIEACHSLKEGISTILNEL